MRLRLSRLEISLLFLFFGHITAIQEPWYCSGIQLLTNNTGVITDHTGPGNYQEKVTCTWVITLNAERYHGITLIFEKFELEFGWDFLYIYSGATNSIPNYVLTGYELPPVITISSLVVILEFVSDPLISYAGFLLRYYGALCPDECSGNGYCLLDKCICNEGFLPPSCSVFNCNKTSCGDGKCADTHCICPPGSYGHNCQQVYCSGVTEYTTENGTIRDHYSTGDYLPWTNCAWKIMPNSGGIIVLHFRFIATEPSDDFIKIYDGRAITEEPIRVLSGTSLKIEPVIANSGVMTIIFSSNGANNRLGFEAYYETINCPEKCNGNGHCNLGTCLCENGWYGDSCSEARCEIDCGDYGKCVKNECICDDGWRGRDCSSCEDFSICSNETETTAYRDLSLPSLCNNETVMISQENGSFIGYLDLQLNQSSCSWTISPLHAQSILLTITRITLVDGISIVISSDSEILSKFTQNSSAQHNIIARTPTVISFDGIPNNVAYSSRKISTFSLTFISLTCPHNCSNTGTCINGVCICSQGFTGRFCSQKIPCFDNCSGHGTCVNGTCICNPGYFGPHCGYPHCDDLIILTSKSGVITDHTYGSQYFANAKCSWLIKPHPPVSSISLVVERVQFENSWDRVIIYDGPNATSPLLVQLTGSWFPSPVKSSSGAIFIEFHSDSKTELTGFTLTYRADELCNCSNGICHRDGCICNPGLTGPTCANEVVPVRLAIDQVIIGHVPDWHWHYYEFDINQTVGELYINISRLHNIGYPEFYLRYGSVPTLREFLRLYYYYFSDRYLVIRNPGLGKWYLGVYGRKTEASRGSEYSLSVSLRCAGNCGGKGICLNNIYCICNDSTRFMANCSGNGICIDGGCECMDGYSGPSCEKALCSRPCKNGGKCVGPSTCDCFDTGFVGPTCSDLPPYCSPPCRNGGVCVKGNLCDCTGTGFSGLYCTEFVCVPNCQNGGECIGPNQCQCPAGFDKTHFCTPSLAESGDKGESAFAVMTGLVVSLFASVVGLTSVVVAVTLLRRRLRRTPAKGVAGGDERSQ